MMNKKLELIIEKNIKDAAGKLTLDNKSIDILGKYTVHKKGSNPAIESLILITFQGNEDEKHRNSLGFFDAAKPVLYSKGIECWYDEQWPAVGMFVPTKGYNININQN